MFVIPAIDVLEGKVVRLRKGERSEKIVHGELRPTLERFISAGVRRVHVVDLDGAFGAQSDLLDQLSDYPDLRFQIGGGLRSLEKIRKVLARPNFDVVLGSFLSRSDAEVSELAALPAERMIAAFDVVSESGQYVVKDQGWTRSTRYSLPQILQKYSSVSFLGILMTDISRDGLPLGPNLELYQEVLNQNPKVNPIASGGIRDAGDLEALRRVGVTSAVIGRGLYEGAVSLQEVIRWQQ